MSKDYKFAKSNKSYVNIVNMAEDTGEINPLTTDSSNSPNKYADIKKGLVWTNNPEQTNEQKPRSRLKGFVRKLFPFVRSFKHARKRRSFILGAAAGTVGSLGYLKGAEKAEAFLNNIQSLSPSKPENPPPDKETPPANTNEGGKDEIRPSKNDRNIFEQTVLSQAPIEKQAEIAKLMMEKFDYYHRQSGVERQINNTLQFAPVVEKELRECGYPDDQMERRKIALLAQIFVESGGNQYAEQGDPECRNPKPQHVLWMGQGLFQVNITAAKDVIERYNFKMTNIKDPEQNTKLAVLYTKMMEDIFSEELISVNAYHTGQGNMRFGLEALLEKKLGIDPKELEEADWGDLKNYLNRIYPQLGQRKISIFDIFMDPEIKEEMNAHGKKNDSTISFDYTFKLLAAARLLTEKNQTLLAQ